MCFIIHKNLPVITRWGFRKRKQKLSTSTCKVCLKIFKSNIDSFLLFTTLDCRYYYISTQEVVRRTAAVCMAQMTTRG